MVDMIEAHAVVKRFGKVVALDGLDLSVPEGTIVGLLGPNGAGKTTFVSILSTLLKADAGDIRVAGFDVWHDREEVRKRIGLSGQFAAVDEHLTGFENLDMVGRLYHLGRGRARARARELLEMFELTEAADRPSKTYSGGMRRRLDVAAALVAETPVLFLDEPTTGLDPHGRSGLWEVIRDLVARGTTVLLTTQYLEEADQLADEVVVIDHGHAIAHGTPDELKRSVGGERVEITVSDIANVDAAKSVMQQFAIGEVNVDEQRGALVAPIEGGTPTLTKALNALEHASIELVEAGLRHPTLDDVFLTLTGHVADTTEATDDAAAAESEVA